MENIDNKAISNNWMDGFAKSLMVCCPSYQPSITGGQALNTTQTIGVVPTPAYPPVPQMIPSAATSTPKDLDEIFTIGELERRIASEGDTDPNELIKDRFLCKQGGMLFCAQTGCGKSSLIMQMIMSFAVGREFYGLKPAHALKTLLIQGENDARDLYGEISGIKRGLNTHCQLTTAEYEAIDQAITIRSSTAYAGLGFMEHLRTILQQDKMKYDLLVIDPLFSYIGCNVSQDQGSVSIWIRQGLNTLLHEFNLGVILVHHTNKPSKTEATQGNYNQSYDYAGSAELANWARAIINLERINCEDIPQGAYFRLTAPKRGSQLLHYEKFERNLKWATDGGIFWEELENRPMTEKEKGIFDSQVDDFVKCYRVTQLIAEEEMISLAELKARMEQDLGIKGNKKPKKIIDEAIRLDLIQQFHIDPKNRPENLKNAHFAYGRSGASRNQFLLEKTFETQYSLKTKKDMPDELKEALGFQCTSIAEILPATK